MSTALQPAAHQPVALASPPLAPPSGRQYMSPHSSPNREAYHANQAATASPSSRRPPSRKTSGHSASASLDMNSSRPPRPAPAKAHQPERRPSKSDRPSTMVPVAPPRTSSSAQPETSSRRSQLESIEAAVSQQHAPQPGSSGDLAVSPQNHRSKRSGNEPAARPASSRAADVSMPVRSAAKPRDAPEGLVAMVPSNEGLHTREARASYHAALAQDDAAPPPVVSPNAAPDERRATRSRHDQSRSHKGTSKFGDFILGNTIGEGEFGKVKLGWKQDSSVQVAIKLIKRDTVGGNPSRLSKIRREVTILRGVQHPNIVRLIDMIETDRYIGIILEYASGGELFDYILNHRYLKDHSARRLFSQLVSGVGYLHKKGIVHRDLKLENLLLDRNRNIITDFGFANTFDPHDELAEEEELNLTDRDFVKRIGLDKIKPNGSRKGDLMQTSCGSPCYAAPELVVSDSLYTGRKVDVWSCGVILYAMLAGYLPFDDDPANPEGDNINLLYKYIVSTPLTFPEYVTPHARDLLRRILVPNPRKRADLFEVARHSWLSEYAHVVEFITSTTTTPSEAQNASAHHGYADRSTVARSSSVREAAKHKSPAPAAVGGLAKAHAKIDQDVEQAYRTPKDTKRRTVQVEYVAPTTQTQRGSNPSASGTQASRDYEDAPRASPPRRRSLAPEADADIDAYMTTAQSRPTQSVHGNAGPARGARDMRAISDNPQLSSAGARPQTGGSLQSAASMALQSRANYGQPVPPSIADTNVQGRIQQPSNAEDDDNSAIGRPSVVAPSKSSRTSGLHESRSSENRGHKRSSTIGEIGSRLLGRSGSVFGGKSKKRPESQQAERAKKYPPVSMSNAMPQGEDSGSVPRPSIESKASRRSVSLGTGKKRSGSITGSQGSSEKKERRRFSLLPASFSLKAIGLGREYPDSAASDVDSRQDLPAQAARTTPSRGATASGDVRDSSPTSDNSEEAARANDATSPNSSHYSKHGAAPDEGRRRNVGAVRGQTGSHFAGASESSVETRRPPTAPHSGTHAHGSAGSGEHKGDGNRGNGNRGALQKTHKRFTDAYEQGEYRGHEGSSGAAKRVMDFFRRRGRARGGDDR